MDSCIPHTCENEPEVDVFDDNARPKYREWTKTVQLFEGMGLKDQVLRSVYNYGFDRPSAIQQRAITAIMSGHDIIAQAQSGSGKTAAYLIPILNSIDLCRKYPQAVILLPTHELAVQVMTVLKGLSEYLPELSAALCKGGVPLNETIRSISRAHIIVATLGRLKHVREVNKMPKYIRTLVIDEADAMLSRPDDIEDFHGILRSMPEDMQIVLVSATIPEEILTLTKLFMQSPYTILVRSQELTLEGIQQFYVMHQATNDKFATLRHLYGKFTFESVVIFCGGRQRAEDLHFRMGADKHIVSLIHGGMNQELRVSAMNVFRAGHSRAMVATDVMARGIDVQRVSCVFNYDIPECRETYLHRIGRSGRYGRKGVAINFVSSAEEMNRIHEIEEFYETKILPLPDRIEGLSLGG